MALNVLIVDDASSFRSSIKYQLQAAGHRAEAASSGAEALGLLERLPFDVALFDLKMAEMDGLQLLDRVRARWPELPVIFLTAYATVPAAVNAMQRGARHFLDKNGLTRETLIAEIERVRDEAGLGGGGRESPFADFVGSAPAIHEVLERARRFASTDKPLLILGEVGTGKESLARSIHTASARAGGPFVTYRCTDAGADLFAPHAGSAARAGEAHGGTLYLDGVDELSAAAQAELLDFLRAAQAPQAKGAAPARSDARILASSTQDLDALAADGLFRKDLLFELKGVTLRLPPLRERTQDLPKLVQHYAQRHRGRGQAAPKVAREALRILSTQPFPGNLRELENLVEQAIVLAQGAEIDAGVLARLGLAEEHPSADAPAMRTRLEHEERRAIAEELLKNPQNLKQAAKNLNISRTTLWRKMKKYGLEGG